MSDTPEDVTPSLTADPGPTEPAPEVETPAEFDGPEFLKGVDPELLSKANLKTVPDLNTLVKNYVHAQSVVGKDKIVLPDEHASDEDWQQVYKKLGLPEKDEYKLDFGETKYDEDFKKGFLDSAHEAGVLPHQAKKMFDYFHGQVETTSQAQMKEMEQKNQEAIQGLQKEWGAGFQKELKIAQTALRQFADDNVINYLEESGLGNDPNLIKLFNQIGKGLTEDTFNRESVGHLGFTKSEAQEKADSILGSPEHPYWNSEHPGHQNAVRDMERYQEVIHS